MISRTRRLRQIVSPITAPLGSEDRRAVAFVTIELDNLVVFGLRQYSKSSLLRSRTAAGDRISASVRPNSTEEAAAFIFRSLNFSAFAKMKCPQRIDEKKEIIFRDPKQVEKVLLDYSASNMPNFGLALSLNAEVFSEAKICRHFFAHRARNTSEAVRQFFSTLGIIAKDTPEQLMLRGRPNSGVQILDGWLADVENFFDLAT